jgi:hypothetical protein
LFVTVTLPAVAPLAVGEYFTVNVTPCEGASVNGVATPLTEIPEPLAEIWVNVTLVLPVFESCTLWVVLLPTLIFPKLTLAGAKDIVYVAPTPLPLRVTLDLGFTALLVTVIAPDTVPAAVGANLVCKAID